MHALPVDGIWCEGDDGRTGAWISSAGIKSGSNRGRTSLQHRGTFYPGAEVSLSLDTAGSFAKIAYIRDWIQLDIYINSAFPIGLILTNNLRTKIAVSRDDNYITP